MGVWVDGRKRRGWDGCASFFPRQALWSLGFMGGCFPWDIDWSGGVPHDVL